MRSLTMVACLAAHFRYFQQHQQRRGIGRSTGPMLRMLLQHLADVAGAGARARELHPPVVRQVVVLADERQQDAATERRLGCGGLLRDSRGKPPPENGCDESLAGIREGKSARLQHVPREEETGQRKAVGDIVQRRRDRLPTGTPVAGTACPARARPRCVKPRARISATHSPDQARRRSRRSSPGRGRSPVRPASAARNEPSPSRPPADPRDDRAWRPDDREPPDADRAPATAGTARPDG